MAVWVPNDESEIRTAIDDRSLAESHYHDVKREIGTSDGARKESARDMASFAIDGGSLLVGVEEFEGSFRLAPFKLAGEMERLEQIAATRIDPPLDIRVTEIPSESKDGYGYLAVNVAPSPFAPHMVEGVYWARGERTKRKLSDPEVLRLHQKRKDQERVALELLAGERERDPVPMDVGHLYIVAEPATGGRHVARDLARDFQATSQVRLSAEHLLWRSIRDFSYGPDWTNAFVSRSGGGAWTTLGEGGRRAAAEQEAKELIDLEFLESGGIRIFVGGLTNMTTNGIYIWDGMAVAYAMRVVVWATEVAGRIGYRGQWALGILGSDLSGLSSVRSLSNYSMGRLPVFDARDYQEATTASTSEMTDDPRGVADRLVRRLTLALGTRAVYLPDPGEDAGRVD